MPSTKVGRDPYERPQHCCMSTTFFAFAVMTSRTPPHCPHRDAHPRSTPTGYRKLTLLSRDALLTFLLLRQRLSRSPGLPEDKALPKDGSFCGGLFLPGSVSVKLAERSAADGVTAAAGGAGDS